MSTEDEWTTDAQAQVKIDGIELALYHHGDAVTIYVNQGGVCIFRERVALIPELTASGVVSVETLRRVCARSMASGGKGAVRVS